MEDIAFQTKGSEPVPAAPATTSPSLKGSERSVLKDALVSVTISSLPTAAEIELDGSFVGNTPETLKVPCGDHLVILHKHGYKNWERKLRIVSEIVNVSADLEPETN